MHFPRTLAAIFVSFLATMPASAFLTTAVLPEASLATAPITQAPGAGVANHHRVLSTVTLPYPQSAQTITGNAAIISCATVIIDEHSVYYIPEDGGGWMGANKHNVTGGGYTVIFDLSVTVANGTLPASASNVPETTCKKSASTSSSAVSTTTAAQMPIDTQPNAGTRIRAPPERALLAWAGLAVMCAAGGVGL